ncbi:hypothetical protein EUAN_14100 [Andreesenia angusta]|uniref:Rod shape-determining protein MreD n=1 Tax=Andreesenia angusta TaxID=39480 RepID=A0A1S1V9D3_9FIRM|nr:hypothetical protein [Andreesenia angusta]OHW62339.1 hypothetical protein EUAN_14100 [Andreesenia angusta]
MRNRKTRDISRGAMITVLSVVVLYLSTVLVTTKLSLLAASSVLVAIAVVETDLKVGALVYAASSALGFALVPDKLFVLSYIFFFGVYPLAKYAIERLNRFELEWLIKAIVFNVLAFLGYSVGKLFLSEQLKLPLSIWIVVMVSEILFVVYDYAMSLAISYYIERIKPKLG